jgi:exportin-T
LKAIEHYAKETSDPATEKIAFNLLNKMSFVFGPATGLPPINKATIGVAGVNPPQQQPLSGFENLMNQRFSMLCWEVPYSSGFNPKDAQAKIVLGEVASLQKMLYFKLGEAFLESLKGAIFPRIGVNRGVEEYCDAVRRMEGKEFKGFFQASPLPLKPHRIARADLMSRGSCKKYSRRCCALYYIKPHSITCQRPEYIEIS